MGLGTAAGPRGILLHLSLGLMVTENSNSWLIYTHFGLCSGPLPRHCAPLDHPFLGVPLRCTLGTRESLDRLSLPGGQGGGPFLV
jgi:hypothetical protein